MFTQGLSPFRARGGKTTLQPGIYSGGALGLTGTLTLNGGNNPNAGFIFKAASTLITGSNSYVKLVNVNPCNVFWQVTGSATLGTGSAFVGTCVTWLPAVQVGLVMVFACNVTAPLRANARP